MRDYALLFALRITCWIVSKTPPRLGIPALSLLVRIALFFSPQHLAVGRKNLAIAFPERSQEEREAILRDHLRFLGAFLFDTLQLPYLTEDAIRERVHFPFQGEQGNEETRPPGGHQLVLTGHLGSFELFGVAYSLTICPLNTIVRSFQQPALDRWWCAVRERTGSRTIPRSGAYRAMLSRLQRDEPVAVLFDQNVTHSNATFPTWFGLEAATTKAVGHAALKTQCPILIAGVGREQDGHHTVMLTPLPVQEIYHSPTLSKEEKVLAITQRAADSFTAMIHRYPEQWFWLHRRWKTRPDESTSPYTSS
ncbi:hypothetical protein MRY87_04700 [bacterium]|nr:hypothetical protein [bacterium]